MVGRQVSVLKREERHSDYSEGWAAFVALPEVNVLLHRAVPRFALAFGR